MSNNQVQYMVNVDYVESKIEAILNDVNNFSENLNGLFQMCSRIIGTVCKGSPESIRELFDRYLYENTESDIIERVTTLKRWIHILRSVPLVLGSDNITEDHLMPYHIKSSYLESLGFGRTKVSYSTAYYFYSREIVPFVHANILDQFDTSKAIMLL